MTGQTARVSEQEKKLDKINGMTLEMRELAQKQDWKGVASIELERNQFVKSALAADEKISPESNPGRKLAAILKADLEIQQMLEKKKSEIREEVISLKRVRESAEAYNVKT